jgi:hypothetical protein
MRGFQEFFVSICCEAGAKRHLLQVLQHFEHDLVCCECILQHLGTQLFPSISNVVLDLNKFCTDGGPCVNLILPRLGMN